MLGKTHVVNSLAILNAGLVINGSLGLRRLTETSSTHTNTLQMFGFTLNMPSSVLGYISIIIPVVAFVFMLIDTKKRKNKTKWLFWSIIPFLIFGAVYDVGNSSTITLLYFAFIIGSLLPDIDSEKSILGRYITPISSSIPHRTITHTIWIVIFLYCLSSYFHNMYLMMLTLGYTIHIIQDSFSKCGICWFYPIIGDYTHYSGGAVKKTGRTTKVAYGVGGSAEKIIYNASIVINIMCISQFIF